ncbi:hypothetical protein [Methylophaga muralis]|uniref:Guanylate cyclase domain-containing protein n=1 Tax=Methylophaga muralis TaxID=291169 RepID=A0A1E3GPC2_9GAMM|nr:hypothetical protein [Methylophaga muralis]ODN65785.1 hypothetical protein A9E74_02472 [Methylophaga muralis]
MDDTPYKKLRYTKRWFAYFDLLGFAQLVRTREIQSVLPIYERVLETIEEKANAKKSQGIGYSWFSDTFIIFSKGSSLEEFGVIEQIARLFFQKLILHKIPVRGAISYGNLYSQQEKNIFLGEALMDAYEYGEKQNWLNFVITPSAAMALEKLEFPMNERAHYRLITKSGVITHPGDKKIFAYAFNNGTVNGINPLLKALRSMKEVSPKEQGIKYENTIEFIELYGWISHNNSMQSNAKASAD